MKKILKYEIAIGVNKINIPLDAKILTLQIDQKTNKPAIWVIVDHELEYKERIIEVLGKDGQ